MEFSFGAEKYRKNLADELREKRKTDKGEAKEFLVNEKETKQYMVSKDIKLVSTEIRRRGGMEEIANAESTGNKEFDLEIQTFDIQNKIPENLKLYFDQLRLREIQKKFEGFDIKGDHRTSQARVVGPAKEVGRQMEVAEKEDWEIRGTAIDFINYITEGSFDNPEMLNHIVGGENEDGNWIKGTHGYIKERDTSYRYPSPKETEKGSIIPQENVFDIDRASIDNLWFGAGRSHWFDPNKVVIICNPKSERFKKKVAGMCFYDSDTRRFALAKEWNALPVSEMLKNATDYANKSKRAGVNIKFNKPERWIDIADWIVDLYHGRLYMITEKS